ncbi:uncharacterized protein AFUA_3G07760 [Aspergillus fumigatus Af293]|uniref:Uncharacterized protein n=2 Tax=Aspergillus fumigatus TaxID=746128 RepID=Q4WX06_ASPFU|nr:hypothetical protein AFUA_3G07760 [Aspergillus fumigatus Af293]EAL92797.1 hypothetical protein AFUA_3G07760 [Aspergillus fumigatus Af293]EDP52962.1 hypothetical protein AFUB_041340 [Aspergillus fumigatus A1163]
MKEKLVRSGQQVLDEHGHFGFLHQAKLAIQLAGGQGSRCDLSLRSPESMGIPKGKIVLAGNGHHLVKWAIGVESASRFGQLLNGHSPFAGDLMYISYHGKGRRPGRESLIPVSNSTNDQDAVRDRRCSQDIENGHGEAEQHDGEKPPEWWTMLQSRETEKETTVVDVVL